MDANTFNILTLADAETVNTPMWALLMGVVSVLVSAAFSVVAWFNSRTEKSDDDRDETAKENVRLGRDLLLSRIESIADRMKADQAEMRAEMKAAVTAIQASVTRHDSDIDELHRKINALNEWRIAFEAARKGAHDAA